MDHNRAILNVESMGFSMHDRLELLKLTEASEEKLGTSRITDWLSPEFFDTNSERWQSSEDRAHKTFIVLEWLEHTQRKPMAVSVSARAARPAQHVA